MNSSNFSQNLVYQEARPKIQVMLESEFTKEIRIAMREGQVMKEHQTPFPIVVHVLSGRIDFGVEGQHSTLEEGAILSLAGGIPHDLKAIADSVVRLTLSKTDAVARVEKVAESE